jgi:ubiquinone/menaquinone biosynthesis C-methylase UbiE
MTTLESYPLGYSEAEAKRLMDQGAMLEDLTRDLLSRAGLASGMRVLDLGCGVGDVSMLAARIVGEKGSVLGVDRSASSLEIARGRARRRTEFGERANISFVEADLTTFEPDGTFDAIIGRFVLHYVPDRASMLRRLSQSLRPGGVMAMQEYDLSSFAQAPESPLFAEVKRWILDGFKSAGGGTGHWLEALCDFPPSGSSLSADGLRPTGPLRTRSDGLRTRRARLAQPIAGRRAQPRCDCDGDRNRHARKPIARGCDCAPRCDVHAAARRRLVESDATLKYGGDAKC